MKKEIVATLQNEFNAIANILDDGCTEYWYARDLQKSLGYDRWENFVNVLNKAKTACEISGIEVLDHFRDATKMVTIGSNTPRSIEDIRQQYQNLRSQIATLENARDTIK